MGDLNMAELDLIKLIAHFAQLDKAEGKITKSLFSLVSAELLLKELVLFI